MKFRIIVQYLFGEEHLRRQAKVLKTLETQPWAQKDDFYYLTRTEWYVGLLLEMKADLPRVSCNNEKLSTK